MTGLALLFVLLSAVAHATWNFLMKRAANNEESRIPAAGRDNVAQKPIVQFVPTFFSLYAFQIFRVVANDQLRSVLHMSPTADALFGGRNRNFCIVTGEMK